MIGMDLIIACKTSYNPLALINIRDLLSIRNLNQKDSAMHYTIRYFLSCTLLFISLFAHADAAFTKRQDVQAFINEMVQKHGFQRATLNKTFDQVMLQPKIIEAITRPYEKKPWDLYKDRFLTPERLQAGVAFWKANQKTLEKAEQYYGVPANIIVAIIGVETLYGKRQGDYRVIDALSTLAFNYPPRSPFFKKELAEYLLLCREHGVQPTEYLGSYAGAIGKPQFMPSSYRYYAANFTGHPKKDLVHDNEAVIASVANYFHQHGWKMNQSVVQPAQIHGRGYQQINTANKKAEYSIVQLKRAGILPEPHRVTQSPRKAGLIALDTQKGQEFWIAYPNFYVITRYNTSPQYALVVYLLAQQLKNEWASSQLSQKTRYA